MKQLAQGRKPRNDKARNQAQMNGPSSKAGALTADGGTFLVDEE